MSDHSSMATLQNNQPGGFAAAAQRARLIAAKIVVAGGTKRPLEEGPESSPKKLAPVDQGYTASSMSAAAIAAAAAAARIGGSQSSDQTSPPGSMSQSNLMPDQANDYIRVPDKMVGLNRQTRIGGAQSAGHAPPHHLMPEETFEYIRVPDDQFGYLIGRGGEQITRLQADSGCKIQMASDSGQPDRLVTLTGTRDAINRAKELVNLIVNHRGRENASDMPNMGNNNPMPRLQGGGGGGGGGNGGGGGGGLNAMEEIMLPGPKVGLIIGKSGKTIKQLQEQSGAKMVVIQDGPNTEYEKPLRISGEPAKVDHAKQLVFELLAEKDMQFTGGMRQQQFEDSYQQQEPGNGLGGGNSTEVLVPRIAVGVVIGRGGDMIKKIQNETGCRVQFHQERDEGPGDKRCFLQGKQHQVEQAKEMIEDLITSVTRREQDNRNKPRQQRNGGGGDFNQQQQWQSSPDGQEVRVSFSVNNVKCGLIIGRGGEVIKQINAQSGAHCELDRRAQNADRNNRTFYIKGHPDAVENCKRIIMEKVGMPVNFMAEGSNGNGGNGGGGPPSGEFYQGGPSDSGNGGPQQPGGGWGYNPQWHPANAQPPQQKNQVAINPVTGQPDYSQQWISYYRSMGMVREAEAIEQQKAQQIQQHQQQQQQQQQQQPQPQSQPQPQPQPQPQMSDFQGAGPSAGPSNAAPVASQSSSPGPAAVDYSAQWADYYRNLGMLKEAEAIELQIKLKQQQAQQSQSQPQPVVPGPSQGAPVGGPSVTAPGPMGGMYDQQYQVGFPGPGPSAGYSYQSYQYPGGQPGPSGDPHQQ